MLERLFFRVIEFFLLAASVVASALWLGGMTYLLVSLYLTDTLPLMLFFGVYVILFFTAIEIKRLCDTAADFDKQIRNFENE